MHKLGKGEEGVGVETFFKMPAFMAWLPEIEAIPCDMDYIPMQITSSGVSSTKKMYGTFIPHARASWTTWTASGPWLTISSPCRVGRTAPESRSALCSLLLPPFGPESVTVFDPALVRASPSQKPACGFPAQASSAHPSPNGSASGYRLDSRERRISTSACGRRSHRVGSELCPPSLHGRYSVSSLLWGHPTSTAALSFLPVYGL